MNLYFANPLGWLGLGAILPLVYLHFFRRQTRTRIVNTLFLVEKSAVNREAGDLRDRWRHSASFWLQVVALLLLSWLLSQPRWANSQRVGKVAFVLDGSASMSAFREQAMAEVRKTGELIEGRLSSTEFALLDTGSAGGTLYRGRELGKLLGAMEAWKPRSASHSVARRVSDARSLVGSDGFALLVSDRENVEASEDVFRLLVGSELENVGIAGVRVVRREDAYYWRAIVRNYGKELAKREWWLELGDGRNSSRSMELEAGKSVVLEGLFPEGKDSVAVALSEDGFALDDYAPVVVERPKILLLGYANADANSKLFERLGKSVEDCRLVKEGETPDVRFRTVARQEDLLFEGAGVYFFERLEDDPQGLDTSALVPSNHRLNAELSWDGLFFKGGGLASFGAKDEVLLWKGSVPVILLSEGWLVFNFDLRTSNLDRLPAFALLVGRYFEEVRDRKVAPQVINCDTGQVLAVVAPSSGGSLELIERRGGNSVSKTVQADALLEAPVEPGFFSVEYNGTPLLSGATRFADVRESDFKVAVSRSDLRAFDEKLVEEYYDDDFYSPLWLLLLGGAMVGGWLACFRENL